MISYIKSLLRTKPKLTNYGMFWATTKTIEREPVYIGGVECNQDIVICSYHFQIYEAYSIEQAFAMHRSDWPDTQPTLCSYLEE